MLWRLNLTAYPRHLNPSQKRYRPEGETMGRASNYRASSHRASSHVDASKSVAPRATEAELRARGKKLREKYPRSSHATWKAPPDRREAVDLIEEANAGRLPELVPIRHGRMMQSAFTFYRGIALNMAADLAVTPTTGVRVQVCGD